MDESIGIGSDVRYPRTGTLGSVIRFEEKGDYLFAELDSTHLFYRVDHLILSTKKQKISATEDRDKDLKRVKEEHEYLSSSEFLEAVGQQDGACHGGG